MQTVGDVVEDDDAHILLVEDAVNNMDEKLADVVRAIYYEQIPYSQLAERLGCSKTQAWRRAKQARAALIDILASSPIIQGRYGVETTWEDAAWAIVSSYDRVMPRAALIDTIDFCARKLGQAVREGHPIEPYMFNSIAMEAVAELKDQGVWEPEGFHELLCDKQADYGHDNINAFGHIGIAVRIHDKVARLKNLLTKGGDVRNEPLIDTWLDLVGYSVIAEMLSLGTFDLQLGGTDVGEA